MASAAFPSVIAAVMSTAASALNGVRVVRGLDVSNAPGDVVMVGISDIEALGYASAGEFRQTMQTFGGNREEVGTVNALILARRGDGDQDAACSQAFDYLALLEAAVRADPTLGMTSFGYVVVEMESGQVLESQNDDGADAVLPIALSYKIRI